MLVEQMKPRSGESGWPKSSATQQGLPEVSRLVAEMSLGHMVS